MAAIQTSVRYASDGTTAVWPVPFPFGGAGDIGVKIAAADGRERRLVAGTDYVLSGSCVMAVVPAGESLIIWLESPVDAALEAARRRAAAGPEYGPVLSGTGTPAVASVSVPAAETDGSSGAALAAEVSDLRASLDALRAEREAALEAARAAQADAQVRRLSDAGTAELARLAEEATARIAELEQTAEGLRTALLAQSDAISRERTALAEARDRLETSLTPARESLTALDAGVSAARREARFLETLAAETRGTAEEAAAAAEESRKGAETARRGAEAARNGAEDAKDRADASARTAETSASAAAGDRARAELAATAAGRSESDAAAWAESAATSAEQSFGSAQCAWKAAFQAHIAQHRPGIAAVRSWKDEDAAGLLSGVWFANPLLRHSPTIFMGLWPVRAWSAAAWDGVFFLGPPYPDAPVTPPAPPCPPPVEPEGPDGGGGETDGGGAGEWRPCGR